MVLRALQLYKAGDVGGAAARLREISPSANDPFIATVHRLVQGISWMWLAGEQRAAAARTRQEGLIEPLTDRELTILRMLPAPSSLRQLASELFVTPNTLKTHLRAIYRKLGAESREEAVIRARERGLI